MVSFIDDPEPLTRESRKRPRRRVLKQVEVLSLDKKATSAIECTLRDVSGSGARLSGPGGSLSRIPNQFCLVTPGQLRTVRCKVVWKTYDEIGVRFLSGPGALVSDSTVSATFERNDNSRRDRVYDGSPSESDGSHPGSSAQSEGLPALTQNGLSDDRAHSGQEVCYLPVLRLVSGPTRVRESFDQEDLDGLARSIRANGLLQPLLVRRQVAGEDYEIVAGERRWRAAQIAGLSEVPVLIGTVSDGEALEIALVENVQRSDLDPLEEARGYAQLIEHFGYTQQRIADQVGKSRSHVANLLRLLKLPDEVQAHLKTGRLSAGHLRALASKSSPAELANQVVDLNLNVRETEQLVSSQEPSRSRAHPGVAGEDRHRRDLEQAMAEALHLKVEITAESPSSGRLIVHYRTREQLSEICRRLAQQA